MKNNIFLFYSLLLIGLVNSSPIYAKNGEIGELRVRGELVAEPCVLRPGDEDIEVDFGTIVDRYLYINKKSHLESFDIHLEDCDITISDSVSVAFMSANTNSKLPGLLPLDSGSMATNVGIAILDNESNLIEINKPTPMYKLTNGSNVLQFKSYVQGEPDALKSETIGLGTFTATATFILLYD